MHYKRTLILACASLTLLVDAASKSTITQTRTVVATATLGGVDPAAPVATGSAGSAGTGAAAGDDDASGVDVVAGGTGAAIGVGADVDNAGSTGVGSSGNIAGAGTGVGAGVGGDANAQGLASGGANSNSNSNSNMPLADMPSGAGSGNMDGSRIPPTSDGKGPPFANGDMPEDIRGKWTGGDKGGPPPFWAKFAGSSGHPHRLMARGWSEWFGGKTGGSGKVNSNGDNDEGMRHLHLYARDNMVVGGPSWNHVRSGAVMKVRVARGVETGMGGEGKGYGREMGHGQGQGQNQGGRTDGGMGYDGKMQGGSRGRMYA